MNQWIGVILLIAILGVAGLMVYSAYVDTQATGGIRTFTEDLQLQDKYTKSINMTADYHLPASSLAGYYISFGMPGSIYEEIEVSKAFYNSAQIGCTYRLYVEDHGQYGTYEMFNIVNVTLLHC